jgi:hypothetical protein
MRRKPPGETEEMTFCVYNELFPCNSSVTAVALHQDLFCGGGVVRKIIQRLCQDSQHGPHRYEAVLTTVLWHLLLCTSFSSNEILVS